MFGEILLGAWSATGLGWSVLAWRLVHAECNEANVETLQVDNRTLSIFKPLPRLSDSSLGNIATGIESFVAQLDAQTEVLLGVHEADRELTRPFILRLQEKYPQARLRIIYRSTADDVANPKIAWQKILAAHATGELWLWSDADIVAPPDFLARARSEFSRCEAAMLTFPYTIREVPHAPALLEALFVNVEFYPGLLLLRRRGNVDFGIGAGMLFTRDDFQRRIDWDDLGAALADDFVLGQKLGPVSVSRTTVETVAGAKTWREAFAHDLRWTKTVRWNRPWGFFGRFVTMPLLGWLLYVGAHPAQLASWLGLVMMLQLEIVMAAAICWAAGCHLVAGNLLRLAPWTFWRIGLWLACWLPVAVSWNGQVWSSAREQSAGGPGIEPTSHTEPVDNPVRKRDLFAAKRN
jgi:ceramide glucosyltransferase